MAQRDPGHGPKFMNPVECAYCGHHVEDESIVPAVNDDDGWNALAAEHDENCEWVLTRAHRDFTIVDQCWPGEAVGRNA